MAITSGGLTPSDLEKLGASGIPAELARQSQLKRVNSGDGAQLVGRNGGGDYSGIVFPYIWPGESHIREYRLRRDSPDLEHRNGRPVERGKYLSPPGRGNMLYFVPGTPAEWLADVSLPVVITEGEKKGIALWALGWHGLGDAAERPRWLPIALPGVWNWRGTVGKTAGPNGERRDVKGPIPDLSRVAWKGRLVYIVFDANVHTNDSVRAARAGLVRELESRGAVVYLVDLPQIGGVNGVDDLIGVRGPTFVLGLLAEAKPNRVRFNLTELGNAERFERHHGGDVRYCHDFKKWCWWDRTKWVIGATAQVRKLARETARQIYAEAARCEDEGERKAMIAWGRKSESAHARRAMLELADSEGSIPIEPGEFDADSILLNVLNGTLDLRTGKLREHRRGDYLTKMAPVVFDEAAACARWLDFLSEVFEPHPDVVPFLQRAIGYSLTGDVREDCLFVLHGSGRNGKGVLLRTLAAMLGDYARTADFSTFTVRRGDSGPRDDIANMKGRRFVSAQESAEGAALAESLIKWLTGGDLVSARRLYENSEEFAPTWKLWLASNHKPRIRGTDPAIWSRIKLIPFDVTFEGREDRGLKDKLAAELPGILAWAVKGCTEWREHGLGSAESVSAAIAEYRAESDVLGRFVDDACVVGDGFQVKASTFYSAYKRWCDETGERPESGKNFGMRMKNRFEKEEGRGGNAYLGVGLRAD